MKKLICGDNLDVLQSSAIDTASVDVVYLDPPFNSNQFYNLPFTKLGKDAAAVEAFKDIWSWDEATRGLEKRLKSERDTIGLSTYINDVKMLRGGEDSLSAYLVNMAIRLNALKRVMKSTASIYLHCDPTASHYIKMMMDGIFGHQHFRNEIVWKRTTAHSDGKRAGRIHDTILFYSSSDNYIWNKVYQPYEEDYVDKYYRYKDEDGEPWASGDVAAAGPGPARYFNGVLRDPPPGSHWRFSQERIDKYVASGQIYFTKNGFPRYKRYLKSMKGITLQDIWADKDVQPVVSWSDEGLGYPTQKPIALLERIISASSNQGGIVLDPFCGCGTAVHAAERLHRNWIGIDISRFSVGVVKNRLAESFEQAILKQISVSGIPTTVESALALAHEDPWEFEKWACGQLGAKGLYKRPGAKGADAGIDGVIEFYAAPANKTYAIIQVKSGNVKPNDVKALYSDVEEEPLAMAGVFVCFDKFKRTALNSASTKTFKDQIAGNEWPVIQILTIEEMLAGAMPKLPNQVIQQGFKTSRRQPTLL